MNAQDHLSRALAFGGFFTTIFVAAWWTVEPVNAPKMLTLVMTAGACLAILIASKVNLFFLDRYVTIWSVGFSILSIITLLTSADPFELNFYGTSGRNTGVLTYLALVILFLSSMCLKTFTSIGKVQKGFLFAGLLNVAYCLLSILGLELLPWNNIYNTILGTFGNPNFIGAFLGMFGVSILAYSLDRSTSIRNRIIVFSILILVFVEIVKSHAIQGLAVLGLGSALIVWMKLREITAQRLVEVVYLGVVLSAGLLSVAGALQIGPLTKFIYKSSVSLRGEYWQAGWNMGMQHPITGVGMDSYGSWYRRARDIHALTMPGVDTTTNAAHNVFIDVFSYGGFPLFIAYIGILFFVLKSSFRILFRDRKYDYLGVSLVATWACYQAQALISINQIGIAIWGWIFGGLIIAYDRISSDPESVPSNSEAAAKGKKVRVQNNSDAGVSLASIFGLAIALLVSIHPVIADAKWREAMGSGSAEKLQNAALAWPLDVSRLTQATNIFIGNELPVPARLLAEKNVEKFPESYMAWFSYNQLSDLTEEERILIRRELNRLDPNNPEFQ
jgi:hypothetical protein